jgi:hypothetical protein
LDRKTQVKRTLTFIRQKIKNEQITMRILTLALLFPTHDTKVIEENKSYLYTTIYEEHNKKDTSLPNKEEYSFPEDVDETIFELYFGIFYFLLIKH